MDFGLDKYTYRARLLPSLIATSPIAWALAAWFPTNSAAWKVIGTFAISSGIVALLPHLARDLGAQKQPSLFRRWGGVPTTRLLSQRTSRLPKTTLARYHNHLRRLIPDVAIPTAAEETANPSRADEVFDSCTAFLRERTRDRKQFPVVFSENVDYGFRRNLWAAKPLGLVSSAIGAISCGCFALLRRQSEQSSLLFAAAGALLFMMLFAMWCFVLTPDWVRASAERYAERLVGSLDGM